jgi:coproporphyrinogen III oxidase
MNPRPTPWVFIFCTYFYDMDIQEIIGYFQQLQQNICTQLEILDGKSHFVSDKWQRPEGGGGDSRVILDGSVFEKGGVNFSHVHGAMPDVLKSESRNGGYFHATGVSIVIHTQNPFVPIIHMNVRYFEMRNEPEGTITDCWFGGGIDLSPAYPNEEDARFFHGYLKDVCDHHDVNYYPEFKKWCDNYFTLVHRKQMRGIGGIFFDHLRPKDDADKQRLFSFVKDVGNSFAPVYSEIVNRNKQKSFTEVHKEWQMIRRGYYAEFNLVYDRGTHFGLKTNGRIESILMSLPPIAGWKYNHQPAQGSEEQESLRFFQPTEW